MGLKAYFASRRDKKAAINAAKHERNDTQRQSESLLRIAMKRHTSLNSLTPRDPKQAHLNKQARLRAEAEAEAQLKAEAVAEADADSKQETKLMRQDSVAGEQVTGDRDSSDAEAGVERRAMAEMGTASCLNGVVPGGNRIGAKLARKF